MAKDFLYNYINNILRKIFPYVMRALEIPLIQTGKFVGSFFTSYFRSQFFFLFPFYHIGGAEKVHLNITSCFKDYNPIVFFADKSKNSALKKEFMRSARTFDLRYFNNPLLIYLWVGVLSTILNNNKNCVVFGSNNLLFYRLIPYLNPEISCIDLLHAFGGGIENFSLQYVDRLDKRVVINTRTLQDLKDQYHSNGISEKMIEKVFLIENCISIPEKNTGKNRDSVFRILYVGRGSEEKRVNLIGEISYLCHQKGMPVEFVLVGDLKSAMPKQYREYCNFVGEIVNEKEISEIYDSSDILLLVSSYEGFPLVIMEAMAHGVITISTDVGGISQHIHSGSNGFLIKNESEDIIVKNVCEVIKELISDQLLMNKISIEAYKYAKAYFNCEKFCLKYKDLILHK
ncbi:MAG: glycosyltransferase family 4 protein [Methanosarcina sp.]